MKHDHYTGRISGGSQLYETQRAIGLIKNVFQVKLSAALHLKRVTAPLFVDPATGLNDVSTEWSAL